MIELHEHGGDGDRTTNHDAGTDGWVGDLPWLAAWVVLGMFGGASLVVAILLLWGLFR